MNAQMIESIAWLVLAVGSMLAILLIAWRELK